MQPRSRLDEREAESARNRLGSRVDAELRVDVLDVRRDRLRRDPEFDTDLGRPESVGEQLEHLVLATREPNTGAVPGFESPQVSLHARQELVGPDGLRQAVVRSQEQTRDTVA